VRLLLRGSLLFATCAFGVRPSAAAGQSISTALREMYNSQYDASRETLSAYSATHPADPLGYSLRAASFLFSELDRSGALSHSLLKDDHGMRDATGRPVDPASTAALNEAAARTREHAQAALALNSRDTNALLALCIVSGVQRDYLALVQHKLRESYEYIKQSQEYSSRLLEADPTAYDAYLTKGFTEYLVASLPFYLRWPMKLDNVSGSKQQGLEDLRIAAGSGQYLKPFAKLLLAMFYLREKQQERTEKLLAELARDYPDNPSFGQELRKLEVRRVARN
jgi:hypothetical protein